MKQLRQLSLMSHILGCCAVMPIENNNSQRHILVLHSGSTVGTLQERLLVLAMARDGNKN